MNVKKEKSGMELYHITPLKNLPNILTEGLKINTSNNGFVPKFAIKNYYKKYGLQPIFLTTRPIDVYNTQLTKSYVRNNRCVILSVNGDGLDLECEYEYLKTNPYPYKSFKDINPNIIFKRDFISRSNIKPERIKIFSCAMAFFFFGQLSTNFNTKNECSTCG